jgi:hypothetical protein
MYKFALAAIAVFLVGCSSNRPPTERERDLEALEGRPASYDREWQAAQLCNELADKDLETGPLAESERREYAKRGMEHAQHGIALVGSRVEAHFYKMVCLGRYLDLYGFGAPPAILVADLRTEGELTARIDAKYENAGADRFLGYFYFQCPDTGPYAYGDPDKAEEHFQKALQIAGDYPENRIGYAEFQIFQSNPAGARDQLKLAIEQCDKTPGISQQQRDGWKKKAQKLLDGLPR